MLFRPASSGSMMRNMRELVEKSPLSSPCDSTERNRGRVATHVQPAATATRPVPHTAMVFARFLRKSNMTMKHSTAATSVSSMMREPVFIRIDPAANVQISTARERLRVSQ